mgnify:CR=1 FL=1
MAIMEEKTKHIIPDLINVDQEKMNLVDLKKTIEDKIEEMEKTEDLTILDPDTIEIFLMKNNKYIF